jgi:hypothetical protein
VGLILKGLKPKGLRSDAAGITLGNRSIHLDGCPGNEMTVDECVRTRPTPADHSLGIIQLHQSSSRVPRPEIVPYGKPRPWRCVPASLRR